jgi:hypothetical protein
MRLRPMQDPAAVMAEADIRGVVDRVGTKTNC